MSENADAPFQRNRKELYLMKTGEKIKRIRKFRGYNQPDFAEMIGLGENAAPRVAQYESGYRVPSPKLLKTMAEVLDCNPLALMEVTGQNVEELMMLLFWLEEEHPGMFHAFELQRLKQKAHHNTTQKSHHDDDTDGQTDSNVYYRDGDNWPAHAPCGLWIDNQLLNGFMREWLYHQQELKENAITREEYFEWKIGWPYTCDECGKRKPAKQWRRSEV
ncbi:MAG: helix-turn-helix transcriptional regulator [Clostridia bacterium]|nr:helix-turn-helix transcriptional regulator [Clostridia bacterium]